MTRAIAALFLVAGLLATAEAQSAVTVISNVESGTSPYAGFGRAVTTTSWEGYAFTLAPGKDVYFRYLNIRTQTQGGASVVGDFRLYPADSCVTPYVLQQSAVPFSRATPTIAGSTTFQMSYLNVTGLWASSSVSQCWVFTMGTSGNSGYVILAMQSAGIYPTTYQATTVSSVISGLAGAYNSGKDFYSPLQYQFLAIQLQGYSANSAAATPSATPMPPSASGTPSPSGAAVPAIATPPVQPTGFAVSVFDGTNGGSTVANAFIATPMGPVGFSFVIPQIPDAFLLSRVTFYPLVAGTASAYANYNVSVYPVNPATGLVTNGATPTCSMVANMYAGKAFGSSVTSSFTFSSYGVKCILNPAVSTRWAFLIAADKATSGDLTATVYLGASSAPAFLPVKGQYGAVTGALMSLDYSQTWQAMTGDMLKPIVKLDASVTTLPTPTPSQTMLPPSASPSTSLSASASNTATQTGTGTSTMSESFSNTATVTPVSATSTATPSGVSFSATSTATGSVTIAASASRTAVPTGTGSGTITGTRTASTTGTGTSTVSISFSATASHTVAASLSGTSSSSMAPSQSAMPSATNSDTASITRTADASQSVGASPSGSMNETPSPTMEASLSGASTPTSSHTADVTTSPTSEATQSPSMAASASGTGAASATATGTGTAVPTESPTAAGSPSSASTTSPTVTVSPSVGASTSSTPSPSSTSGPKTAVVTFQIRFGGITEAQLPASSFMNFLTALRMDCLGLVSRVLNATLEDITVSAQWTPMQTSSSGKRRSLQSTNVLVATVSFTVQEAFPGASKDFAAQLTTALSSGNGAASQLPSAVKVLNSAVQAGGGTPGSVSAALDGTPSVAPAPPGPVSSSSPAPNGGGGGGNGSGDGGSSNTGAIVGGILAAIAAVGLITGFLIWRNKVAKKDLTSRKTKTATEKRITMGMRSIRKTVLNTTSLGKTAPKTTVNPLASVNAAPHSSVTILLSPVGYTPSSPMASPQKPLLAGASSYSPRDSSLSGSSQRELRASFTAVPTANAAGRKPSLPGSTTTKEEDSW